MAYKLEYKLTQQTPMIHFQGDDPGATLRGTELKPKLDRFIWEWCRRHHRKVASNWLQDSSGGESERGNLALRYKVSIGASNPVVDEVKRQQTVKDIYFGRIQYTVFCKQQITLTIICFVPDLGKTIHECIETFFVTEAFGSRQNRGFGCFTLEGTTEESATNKLVDWFGKDRVYCIDYRKSNREPKPDQMIGDAYVIYRVLKSGLNDGDDSIFVRSYLTKYFRKRGIGGEKRFLKKENMVPAIGHSAKTRHDEDDIVGYRYTRAVLGIAPLARYQKFHGAKRNSDYCFVDYKDKKRAIRRYPSPIIVRICGQKFFVIANEPDSKIFDRTFLFTTKYKGKHTCYLRTPSESEFGSMVELFSSYADWLNTAITKETGLDEDQLHLRSYGDRKHVMFLEKGLTLDACKQGGGTQ